MSDHVIKEIEQPCFSAVEHTQEALFLQPNPLCKVTINKRGISFEAYEQTGQRAGVVGIIAGLTLTWAQVYDAVQKVGAPICE